MNKIVRITFILMICLSSLALPTGAHAERAQLQTMPSKLLTIPANFSINSYFSGSGAYRTGTCKTSIATPRASNKAAVKCEMQDNAGNTIDYKEKFGTFGGPGVSVTVSNLTRTTGRLVLFSTHDMWVNSTDYVEYRQIQSAG